MIEGKQTAREDDERVKSLLYLNPGENRCFLDGEKKA